jgi:hypothetical protein
VTDQVEAGVRAAEQSMTALIHRDNREKDFSGAHFDTKPLQLSNGDWIISAKARVANYHTKSTNVTAILRLEPKAIAALTLMLPRTDRQVLDLQGGGWISVGLIIGVQVVEPRRVALVFKSTIDYGIKRSRIIITAVPVDGFEGPSCLTNGFQISKSDVARGPAARISSYVNGPSDGRSIQ